MAHLGFGRGVTFPLTLAVAAAAFPLAPAYGTDVEPLKAQVKGIVQHLTQDCRHDLDAFCSTVTPGEGRLAFCLMAHADKRSEACDAGLMKARQEAEEIVAKSSQACERDIETLCSGTQPGQGRVVQCLLDQRVSLSNGCGEVADVVERVVFPASNQPHTTDVAAAQAPVEAPADAAGVPPERPVVEAALSALDAKVAGIIEKGVNAGVKPGHCGGVKPGQWL
ncbi:MAG: cysteine rich repeat-containing protein [Hyphomicrobium sp.]